MGGVIYAQDQTKLTLKPLEGTNKDQLSPNSITPDSNIKLMRMEEMSTNGPFYSCVLSCQDFDLEWGSWLIQ